MSKLGTLKVRAQKLANASGRPRWVIYTSLGLAHRTARAGREDSPTAVIRIDPVVKPDQGVSIE